MFSHSDIDAGLIQAYLETHYRVHDAPPFTMRVDDPSDALAAAHKRHRSVISAFITACNPLSVSVDAATNHHLHTELGKALVRRSLRHLEGVGEHPTNLWPSESGYLIFGLALESAKTLGRDLNQNAIVWSGLDAIPKLILLR